MQALFLEAFVFLNLAHNFTWLFDYVYTFVNELLFDICVIFSL